MATEEQKLSARRKSQEKWRRENPELQRRLSREGQATWRKNHPEERKARQRAQDLKKNYGISVEEYEALSAAQGGVCAICGNPPIRRRLDTDHDHKTGKIRGLLCPNCNNGLGRFLDSPRLLELAKKYLDKFFGVS